MVDLEKNKEYRAECKLDDISASTISKRLLNPRLEFLFQCLIFEFHWERVLFIGLAHMFD